MPCVFICEVCGLMELARVEQYVYYKPDRWFERMDWKLRRPLTVCSRECAEILNLLRTEKVPIFDDQESR